MQRFFPRAFLLTLPFTALACTPVVHYHQPAPPQTQTQRAPLSEPKKTAPGEEAPLPESDAPAELDSSRIAEAEHHAAPQTGSLWRWKLQSGESYALQYTSTTDLKMTIGGAMGGMMEGMMGSAGIQGVGEVRDRIEMETSLELRVLDVLPDGRFHLEIPVTSMTISSASGERITINELPSEVRVLRAYMTPRGNVEFYERVMVEVTDKGPRGIAVFSQSNGAVTGSVSASADGMEISASATIDPRTGRVTMTSQVRERERRTRQVEEEHPVQHIDVLPAEVLTLLELPEGPVAPGDRFSLEMPVGTVTMTAGDPVQCSYATCGHLRVQMDVDTSPMNEEIATAHRHEEQHPAGGDFDDFDDFDDFNDDFGSDMPAGFGMPTGEPTGGELAAMSPTMKSTTDVVVLFDIAAGQLFNIEGTISSTSGASGMKFEDQTTFMLIFFE